MRKQKENSNNLVTKKYFKDYLDKKLQDFATKDDVKQQIRSTEHYLDYRINTIEKKLDVFISEFNKLKDWMYDKLDWFVGKYKKFDQEHAVSSEQTTRMTDQLDNHEKRITVLEKKAVYKTS